MRRWPALALWGLISVFFVLQKLQVMPYWFGFTATSSLIIFVYFALQVMFGDKLISKEISLTDGEPMS